MGELEQIVQLIQGLGGEAKAAFIVYLVARYGTQIVLLGMGMTTVVLVVKRIVQAVAASDNDTKHVERLRGIINSGNQYQYEHYQHRQLIEEVIKRLQKDEKNGDV